MLILETPFWVAGAAQSMEIGKIVIGASNKSGRYIVVEFLMEQVKIFDEDAVLLEVGSILLSTHECKGILHKTYIRCVSLH